ncbi:MAG TPA: STAS domain-containing protein, partial [Allocoleopsis sp.]
SFMQTEASVILIDFTEVTFMDSSGLGAIVLALKTVNAAGKKLYLCSVSSQVEMVLTLTNMNRVFKIYSNPDDFKRKLVNET